MKLSAPWVTFYHEMEALFKKDPEIHLMYDEEECVIKVYVDNPVKAEALTELLPESKQFGNVELMIDVIPANAEKTKVELFRDAFQGNEAFEYIFSVPDTFSLPINYVVFKNEVVQFFNDELGDIHGNKSTLYQELAKDIFEGNCQGIYFCTETPENTLIGEPAGNWPNLDSIVTV